MDKTLLPELIEKARQLYFITKKLISAEEEMTVFNNAVQATRILDYTLRKQCERDYFDKLDEIQEDINNTAYEKGTETCKLLEQLVVDLKDVTDKFKLIHNVVISNKYLTEQEEESLKIDLKDVADKFNLIHDVISSYDLEWTLDEDFTEDAWLNVRKMLNKVSELVSSHNLTWVLDKGFARHEWVYLRKRLSKAFDLISSDEAEHHLLTKAVREPYREKILEKVNQVFKFE